MKTFFLSKPIDLKALQDEGLFIFYAYGDAFNKSPKFKGVVPTDTVIYIKSVVFNDASTNPRRRAAIYGYFLNPAFKGLIYKTTGRVNFSIYATSTIGDVATVFSPLLNLGIQIRNNNE